MPSGVPGKTERKQVPLRLSPKVHDAMRRWADDDLRSLNAQIEKVLHDALVKEGKLPRE